MDEGERLSPPPVSCSYFQQVSRWNFFQKRENVKCNNQDLGDTKQSIAKLCTLQTKQILRSVRRNQPRNIITQHDKRCHQCLPSAVT